MDTLLNIPVCHATAAPAEDGCNQCDCKVYFPVFDSPASSHWKIVADCPCVTNDLISKGIIKCEGNTVESGRETERIIREHIRNHSRLPRNR